MDRDVVLKTPVLRWTMRETRYLIGWITIGVIALAIGLSVMPLVVPMLDNLSNSAGNDGVQYWLVSNVLYLPLMYIVSRWMLILPAIAVDSSRQRMGLHGR
ncbi:hypothetical protein [Aliamphritea spongicola]|nr:hypothetical protein [Aliamphritea spongicola]